jgi:hypothetical protein
LWTEDFPVSAGAPEVSSVGLFRLRRAVNSIIEDTPINPKKPKKAKTPCHLGLGMGMNPRQPRQPSAERFTTLRARGEVKVSPGVLNFLHLDVLRCESLFRRRYARI